MPRRRGRMIRITLRSRWQDCSAGSANQIRPARYEHPATTPSESGGVMTVLFNQHWEVSPGKHLVLSIHAVLQNWRLITLMILKILISAQMWMEIRTTYCLLRRSEEHTSEL